MRTRSLFEDTFPPGAPQPGSAAPLADRMRPRRLEEILGQEDVLGSRGFLRRAVEADRLPSMVFWGPPGVGKTTLARVIAETTQARFVPFSAVTSGIREMREVMEAAARWRQRQGGHTVLFVDEIHRFNRAQQDAFLPYVESGAIVLIGATTENPSFELNGALLSRLRVVVLRALPAAAVEALLDRALADRERGLGDRDVAVEASARAVIVTLADGDARRALNLLEQVVEDRLAAGDRTIGPEHVRAVAQRKTLFYDRAGEEHYNLISALHKSLRESDPDAALYWLERMLMAGEDRHFLARRLVRFASEDVGLADPAAVAHTLAAWDAFDRLGVPEGDLALAQAAIYLALAPKSVAVYRGSQKARRAIEEHPAASVPLALRNPVTGLMRELDYGRAYRYAPDTGEESAGLSCLPEELRGERFYVAGDRGFEAELAVRQEQLEQLRRRLREAAAGAVAEKPSGRD